MIVHITHCCVMHGCKYGDPGCPVKLGQAKQLHMCEHCDFELEECLEIAYLMNEMYDRGRASVAVTQAEVAKLLDDLIAQVADDVDRGVTSYSDATVRMRDDIIDRWWGGYR